MKVLYDHQAFYVDRVGGVTRYFNEIIRHMPDDVETRIVAKTNMNIYVKDLLPDAWHIDCPQNRIGKKIVKTINQIHSLKEINKGDFDILHATNNEIYYLNHCHKPVVTTIHDMIYEKYNLFPKVQEWRRKQCQTADHIITVSQWTKKDLIEIYHIQPEKISVIYHGSDIIDFPLIDPELGRYILYVGKRNDYKNFNTFLKACSLIIEKDPELKIVCAGLSFTKEEMSQIKRNGLERNISCHFVSDIELMNLYAHAQCFVYPSLYEGFGIPILEAWRCHCPIALSSSTCFPEIAGDAAAYFDGSDPEDMCSTISSIIYNEEKKQRLITLGNDRVNLFTWDKAAQETRDVYKSLL